MNSIYTALKARWLAWYFLALLVLVSIDTVVLGADNHLKFAALFFFGACSYKRAWDLVPAALFCLFFYVVPDFYPKWVWSVPTAPFLFPLLLMAICCLPFAKLRESYEWLRRGEIDQVSGFLVVLTSLISALALILWALWTNYLGVASQMLSALHTMPRWFSLLVVVPGFAVVNAFAEEAVYRGVLMNALEKRLPDKPWLVLAVQASAFAEAHYHGGFPNGKLGYLMTFVYAGMLGHLRKRTGGMLAPYIAHVVADLVIGATLVLLAS